MIRDVFVKIKLFYSVPGNSNITMKCNLLGSLLYALHVVQMSGVYWSASSRLIIVF